MKVTYYLPAHISCFGDAYTQGEVDRAISLFKGIIKPDKLGDIPEEFIFVTESGKNLNPVFRSNEMNPPDEKTEKRWIENTDKLARAASDFHVKTIKEFLIGLKPKS